MQRPGSSYVSNDQKMKKTQTLNRYSVFKLLISYNDYTFEKKIFF